MFLVSLALSYQNASSEQSNGNQISSKYIKE